MSTFVNTFWHNQCLEAIFDLETFSAVCREPKLLYFLTTQQSQFFISIKNFNFNSFPQKPAPLKESKVHLSCNLNKTGLIGLRLSALSNDCQSFNFMVCFIRVLFSQRSSRQWSSSLLTPILNQRKLLSANYAQDFVLFQLCYLVLFDSLYSVLFCENLLFCSFQCTWFELVINTPAKQLVLCSLFI